MSARFGAQLRVVERVGQEVVQQRAERQPVRPARGEVLQLHILDNTPPYTFITTLVKEHQFISLALPYLSCFEFYSALYVLILK